MEFSDSSSILGLSPLRLLRFCNIQIQLAMVTQLMARPNAIDDGMILVFTPWIENVLSELSVLK